MDPESTPRPTGANRVSRALRRGSVLAGAALALVLAFAGESRAESTPTEYDVKAALLFNFGKFTDWPAGHFAAVDSPFVIGVVGVDPFGAALDRAIAGKALAGHPVVVRRWKRDRDLAPCQILFVAGSESCRLSPILDNANAHARLVVGDSPDFAQRGGAIGFVVDDARIRFEINPGAVERAHVRMSSKLLGLARLVSNEP